MPSGVYKRTKIHSINLSLAKIGTIRPKSVCLKISETMKAKKINVGKSNPMFGNHISKTQNHKNKISRALTGRKRPEISLKYKGKGNPNWQEGGVAPLGNKIRELEESKNWRTEVFLRDNYTCQNCNKRGVILHAHHIKEFNIILNEFLQFYSQFSPIEDKETLIRLAITYIPFWDINNGKTLCKKCHNLIKHKRYFERK